MVSIHMTGTIGMVEGLYACRFAMAEVVACFLPFTSKSRLPTAPWLVWLYLRLRLAWRGYPLKPGHLLPSMA